MWVVHVTQTTWPPVWRVSGAPAVPPFSSRPCHHEVTSFVLFHYKHTGQGKPPCLGKHVGNHVFVCWKHESKSVFPLLLGGRACVCSLGTCVAVRGRRQGTVPALSTSALPDSRWTWPSRHGPDSGARLAAPSDLLVSTPTAGALQASDPQAYAASTLTAS